ncbi:hypothetical protein BC938DRAFT_475656, partial [Jimgerdemannia flammicorona]
MKVRRAGWVKRGSGGGGRGAKQINLSSNAGDVTSPSGLIPISSFVAQSKPLAAAMATMPRATVHFPETNKTFHLWRDPDVLDLGRGKKTGIESDPYVSRNQVKIVLEDGKCFIERVSFSFQILGSNPSVRNGQALPLKERVQVFNNDRFALLQVRMQTYHRRSLLCFKTIAFPPDKDKYPFTIYLPTSDEIGATQPVHPIEPTTVQLDPSTTKPNNKTNNVLPAAPA